MRFLNIQKHVQHEEKHVNVVERRGGHVSRWGFFWVKLVALATTGGADVSPSAGREDTPCRISSHAVKKRDPSKRPSALYVISSNVWTIEKAKRIICDFVKRILRPRGVSTLSIFLRKGLSGKSPFSGSPPPRRIDTFDFPSQRSLRKITFFGVSAPAAYRHFRFSFAKAFRKNGF